MELLLLSLVVGIGTLLMQAFVSLPLDLLRVMVELGQWGLLIIAVAVLAWLFGD
uniref:Uncharacterized protein n=1 Tax=Cyanothece sp. (strain PCC 7425 / ATCC 29141) TaxID=395961 RepID=B8HSZ8_CYAP4